MEIFFPIKYNDDELILVKNKITGKILWWNKTKNLFAVCPTPFMREIKQYAENFYMEV